MISVTLYTREDCHLCEQTKADLETLQSEFPHQLVEVDVDSDESLRLKYGNHIPVVEVGPYQRRAPITRQELKVTLGAAKDRERQLQSLKDPKHEARKRNPRRQQITRTDRFSFWFSAHYIWVLNLAVLIYIGLPFLAPILMRAGLTTPAALIYRPYGLVCHQLAFRSWFLFGEQPVYPREAAGVEGLESFGNATALGEGNTNVELLEARRFVGNERVGYKVAFCERDVAIYAAILLFGVIYALSGRRIPALPWYFWILIGILPIGLDGFSQLFSQPPFGLWAYRESTPFLRTLTGGLFGFTTAWFGYPLVEETMQDTRRTLLVKFERIKKQTT